MITAEDIQAIRNDDPGAVLPGIDTMTGNPYATSSLLDVTKITQSSLRPTITPRLQISCTSLRPALCSAASISASATVIIEANNVTIEDSTFSDTTSFWAIYRPTASGATVENCTFTGSKSPTEKNIWISSYWGHNNRG